MEKNLFVIVAIFAIVVFFIYALIKEYRKHKKFSHSQNVGSVRIFDENDEHYSDLKCFEDVLSNFQSRNIDDQNLLLSYLQDSYEDIEKDYMEKFNSGNEKASIIAHKKLNIVRNIISLLLEAQR